MRIAIFMEDYFCGGVDTFIINLINGWPNASDKLILFCNSKHSGIPLIKQSINRPFELVVHNIRTFTGFFEHPHRKMPFNSWVDFILRLTSPILRYLFLIYNIFALRKILLRNFPDRLIVVNNGYPAGDSCRAATISWGIFSKKPLSIHNFHGIALKPGWHVMLQEYLVDILVSKFSRNIIAVSRACAESISCRKRIYRRHKIKYIYNGIDPSYCLQLNSLSDPKSEFGIPSTGRLCLMLGAYHRNKNFDKGHYFLFHAFKKVIAEVPSAHLLVCGYGLEKDIQSAKRIIAGLNLEENVHLFGFRNDVAYLLKHTDILLISSQAFESFCLTSIEAMAQHVPVVATNVGAIPEIVINGRGGYCVERNNTDLYADYVIKLLKDEQLRIEQGELGFQRYKESFTAHRMSEEYAKLIYHG